MKDTHPYEFASILIQNESKWQVLYICYYGTIYMELNYARLHIENIQFITWKNDNKNARNKHFYESFGLKVKLLVKMVKNMSLKGRFFYMNEI